MKAMVTGKATREQMRWNFGDSRERFLSLDEFLAEKEDWVLAFSSGKSRGYPISLSPKELQDLLDEVQACRSSRKRAWENLQEFRWVLKDLSGIELPPPARKTIDLEGRIVKEGLRKALTERQIALDGLLKAVCEFRKFADQPLTLRGGDYAQAVLKLNQAIDRAQGLLKQ
jgi:hypothetical protein